VDEFAHSLFSSLGFEKTDSLLHWLTAPAENRLILGVQSCQQINRMHNQTSWKPTLAARSRRFGSFLLDGLVYLLCYFLLVFIVRNTDLWVGQSASLLLCLGMGFYSFLMHGKYGQTLGKMRHDIEVVNATYGTPLGYAQAFMRSLPLFIINAIISVAGVMSWQANDTLSFESSDSLAMAAHVYRYANYALYAWLVINAVVLILHPKRRSLADLMAGSAVVLKRHAKVAKASI